MRAVVAQAGAGKGRGLGAAITLALVLVSAALPWYGGVFLESLAISAGILAVVTVSWNMMGGFGGLFSFGHAGFFGVGAYAAALSVEHIAASAPVALIASALAPAAFALLILPCFRADGIYFAIITLALAEALGLIAGKVFPGGQSGVFMTPMFSVDSPAPYLIVLAALLLAVAVSLWVRQSRLGWALSALRDDAVAAEGVGVGTFAAKAKVTFISAAFAGLGGGLYAVTQSFVSPESAFDVNYSILPVLAATLGGVGTVAGPILGAVVWSVLNEMVREGAGTSGSLALLIYGAVLILLSIFLPRGLMGLIDHVRAWRGA